MQPRALLPPAMQATFARRLLASRTLDFAGLWPLHKSVKKFFACGGLRVSGHRAWLPCCLPAAHRVGLLSFRRHAFCIKCMPCFGVEVKRGIHCGGLCV